MTWRTGRHGHSRRARFSISAVAGSGCWATRHVPHAWEAILLHEETTRTLFCGDLLTHAGNGPALTESDIIEPAIKAENPFRASALTPATAPTLRRLAELEPRTLAVMHGSSYRGNGAAALRALADGYEALFAAALREVNPA